MRFGFTYASGFYYPELPVSFEKFKDRLGAGCWLGEIQVVFLAYFWYSVSSEGNELRGATDCGRASLDYFFGKNLQFAKDTVQKIGQHGTLNYTNFANIKRTLMHELRAPITSANTHNLTNRRLRELDTSKIFRGIRRPQQAELAKVSKLVRGRTSITANKRRGVLKN